MRIGITGGIGSGKSYICGLLREKGYPVYNCDDEAKRLMVENKEIIDGLCNLMGQDAYIVAQPSHSPLCASHLALNKALITSYLFASHDNAAKVNAIVHPVVKADFLHWADCQRSAMVFMECAILFESGFDDVVDKTVLVYADKTKRLERTLQRDHTTTEKVLERMRQQISPEEACQRADYILDNNDFTHTEEKLKQILSTIKTTL